MKQMMEDKGEDATWENFKVRFLCFYVEKYLFGLTNLFFYLSFQDNCTCSKRMHWISIQQPFTYDFLVIHALYVEPSGVQALKNPKPFEGC